MRCWLATAALVLAGVASAATPPEIRFESGRLSVRAYKVKATELFDSIRKRTGVTVVLDEALAGAEVSANFQKLDIERGIRTLVTSVPGASGHSVSYARGGDRRTRLVSVRVFAPGNSRAMPTPTPPRVAALPTAAPITAANPTPDEDERIRRMMDAGVPRDTAERVMDLTQEVQRLQSTPIPGTLSPEDLGPESREQLQTLMGRGVPMERAVQMLLIQERYRSALEELRRSQATHLLGDIPPAPPAP
ncbi:MAG: hypothetical protein ACREQJ_11615 [Candidatus Binatia bacterium]